jgi:hypothetical protein
LVGMRKPQRPIVMGFCGLGLGLDRGYEAVMFRLARSRVVIVCWDELLDAEFVELSGCKQNVIVRRCRCTSNSTTH